MSSVHVSRQKASLHSFHVYYFFKAESTYVPLAEGASRVNDEPAESEIEDCGLNETSLKEQIAKEKEEGEDGILEQLTKCNHHFWNFIPIVLEFDQVFMDYVKG